MKKILFLTICLFISITHVQAFDIDMDKINIESKSEAAISKLENTYKIEANGFSNGIVQDENVTRLVKNLVYLAVSNKDITSREKEYDKYLYLEGGGTSTLSTSTLTRIFFDDLSKYNLEMGYIKSIQAIPFNGEDVLAFVYLNDVKVNKNTREVIMVFWLKKGFNGYKLFYPWVTVGEDLKDYFNRLTKNENNGNTIGGSYNKLSLAQNDVKVDEAELKNLFSNNKDSSVQITGMNGLGNNMYGSGFFIREGVIATTWSLFLEFLANSNYLYVNDSNGNVYYVSGVVAANSNYDVVLLRLNQETGKKVTFGNVNNLKTDDKLFMIDSKNNGGFSITYGSFISSENGRLRNLFALTNSDVGAALYNKNGEVVGFNVADLINSELSYANSTNYLVDMQKMLVEKKFMDIKFTPLDDFKELYYANYANEKEYNSIPKKVWNKYKEIGKIEEKIQLDVIKASYKDRIVSIRYRNQASESLDSIYLVSDYVEELKSEGFELLVNDKRKTILANNDYKIVIKDNDKYLIVLIMEK
jgi:S1-C subfamily serine protease